MNRFLRGGIRFRLLVYAAAIALPLAVVGLVVISAFWRTSREQIDRSIAKQAEIAAVTFEQWLEAQREPLAMIDTVRRSDLPDTLSLILKTHPHWVGLRVLKAGGETELAQPSNATPLPDEVVRNLLLQLKEREWA